MCLRTLCRHSVFIQIITLKLSQTLILKWYKNWVQYIQRDQKNRGLLWLWLDWNSSIVTLGRGWKKKLLYWWQQNFLTSLGLDIRLCTNLELWVLKAGHSIFLSKIMILEGYDINLCWRLSFQSVVFGQGMPLEAIWWTGWFSGEEYYKLDLESIMSSLRMDFEKE